MAVKRIIKQIPNFITSLNLIAGLLAIYFAIDGHLIWAGIFICMASVLDFIDGFSARLLNAQSELGKQLDSLADIVSFGVAPGAILFTLLEFSLYDQNYPIYEISGKWYEWLILFSSFSIPVFSAIRLAKFNTDPGGGNFFLGLPTPANGLFWASLGLMLEMPDYQELLQMLYSTKNLLILGLFMAGMMVIPLPMFSLKFKSLKLFENWYRYLFLGISLVLVIFLGAYGIASIVFLYILMNLIIYLSGVRYE